MPLAGSISRAANGASSPWPGTSSACSGCRLPEAAKGMSLSATDASWPRSQTRGPKSHPGNTITPRRKHKIKRQTSVRQAARRQGQDRVSEGGRRALEQLPIPATFCVGMRASLILALLTHAPPGLRKFMFGNGRRADICNRRGLRCGRGLIRARPIMI